jgi:hypothetical protein
VATSIVDASAEQAILPPDIIGELSRHVIPPSPEIYTGPIWEVAASFRPSAEPAIPFHRLLGPRGDQLSPASVEMKIWSSKAEQAIRIPSAERLTPVHERPPPAGLRWVQVSPLSADVKIIPPSADAATTDPLAEHATCVHF